MLPSLVLADYLDERGEPGDAQRAALLRAGLLNNLLGLSLQLHQVAQVVVDTMAAAIRSQGDLLARALLPVAMAIQARQGSS